MARLPNRCGVCEGVGRGRAWGVLGCVRVWGVGCGMWGVVCVKVWGVSGCGVCQGVGCVRVWAVLGCGVWGVLGCEMFQGVGCMGPAPWRACPTAAAV